MADWLFSGVLERHPDLRICFAEGQIGWMPYLVERADYVWRKHKYYQNIHPTVAPSELFRRNITGCFIEDEVGVAMLSPGGGHGIAGSANVSNVELFAYPVPR